jgi:hypothetical protein
MDFVSEQEDKNANKNTAIDNRGFLIRSTADIFRVEPILIACLIERKRGLTEYTLITNKKKNLETDCNNHSLPQSRYLIILDFSHSKILPGFNTDI